MPTEGKELIEIEVLSNLLKNNQYFNTVISHLKNDYFIKYNKVFSLIKSFYKELEKPPSIKELVIFAKDSNKESISNIKEFVKEYKEIENPIPLDTLLHLTEKFIRRKIFEEAVIKGADALGKNKETDFNKSYELAEQAIKLSLQDDLGIMLPEVDKVYDDLQLKKGLLTGINSFDKMIYPGYQPKTLHSIMAPSGVGKSAVLVSFACQFLRKKKDVVIISLEMSEAEFYKRVYANLLQIPISQIHDVDKLVLKKKIQDIIQSTGKLIIKEYPAGGLSPLKLDAYLEKLKQEKGFDHPVVMVDYLGLMGSDRMKNSDNSYAYYGSIAEELRAVAQKRNLIMFSPSQLNRSSIGNLEADQSTLSDSMKVYMTLDSAFMILQTPEMKEKSEMKIVFTKNRMSGKTFSFVIKYDYNYFMFIDDYYEGDLENGENLTYSEVNKKEDLRDLENDLLNDIMEI